MALDTIAAQAVARAKQFELAVHDSGPWYIEWGPHLTEATRSALDHEDRVVFDAEFPETCYVSQPDLLVLHCRDLVVAVKEIDAPGDSAFDVRWEFVASTPELAST